MRTRNDLIMMQSLPLRIKESMSQSRVSQWLREMGDAYISFSGGKDSTVLRDIVLAHFPSVPSVFCDTGLEYPEVRQFVKSFGDVEIIRPDMNFREVITTYGYPFISKEVAQNVYEVRRYGKERAIRTYSKFDNESDLNKKYKGRYSLEKWKPLLDIDFDISHLCCKIMKKDPFKKYEKETGRTPIVATMAEESALRESIWLKEGCNAFNLKRPRSAPMSFWREQDVLEYIKIHGIKIASVYGEIVYAENPQQLRLELPGGCVEKLCTTGCQRTGCVFCGFGAHRDGDRSRFLSLKKTHRKLYDYCMGGGGFVNGLWKPTAEGLGMSYVIDQLNRIYGKDFIRY